MTLVGAKTPTSVIDLYGTPSPIRTGDTQVRSLVLYPAELWVLLTLPQTSHLYSFSAIRIGLLLRMAEKQHSYNACGNVKLFGNYSA